MRLLLATLRGISLPRFLRHRLRTAVTAIGVSLGVATSVGLQLAFEPILTSMQHSVEALSGRAVLQISNGELGVPEELLEQVRSVPGVSAAAASIQGMVPLLSHGGAQLYVFGIDLLADREIRDYSFLASGD